MAIKSAVSEFTGTPQWNAWLFALLAFLLVFAPIFRGSIRPLPLFVIEIVATGMVGVLLWQPGCLRKLPASILLVIVLTLLGTAITLIPIPASIWVTLPGRGLYAEGLRLTGDGVDTWRTISVLPLHTEAAWFRLLTVFGVFLATYYLPVDRVLRLVLIVIGIAGVEATLGLMQWGAGGDSILRFGYDRGRDAIGTYANRDHLAGFLAMVSPVVIGLFAGGLGHGNTRNNRNQRRRDFWVSVQGQKTVFLGLVSVLILLGIVFTRSRAGIALAMFGLMLSMFAFAWRLGGSNVYGAVGSVAAVLLVLAAEIGLLPVLDRFSADPMQDARWTIFASTIEGIEHFFPLGSGAGTFAYVYPAFQPIELGRFFINNAHNDFLEIIFEQGMLAVVIIFFALVLYAGRWRKVWIKDTWGAFRFIQVGSGIGVLMLLLHSLGDFNLQIPANAIFFAFFVGVFFKYYNETETVNNPKRHKRRHLHKDNEKDVELTAKAITTGDLAEILEEPVVDITTTATKSTGTKRSASKKITWDDFGGAQNPFMVEKSTKADSDPGTDVSP